MIAAGTVVLLVWLVLLGGPADPIMPYGQVLYGGPVLLYLQVNILNLIDSLHGKLLDAFDELCVYDLGPRVAVPFKAGSLDRLLSLSMVSSPSIASLP